MKANVYSDRSLERYAGRFVWLSINAEAPETAPFLKRYPIPALPTLFILDTQQESVTLRYVGGANVAQLRSMLDDAEQKHRSRMTATADKLLIQGDGLAAEGQHASAARLYDSAIGSAPGRWKRFGRAAEALILSLQMSHEYERCARRAVALYPRVKGTISSANVASSGLICSISLDKEHPKREKFLATLEKATREVFDHPRLGLSGDDRSSLYMALIEARDAAGDEEGVIELQAEWAAFLEKVAASSKTAEQRAVYDSHRVSAYLDVGTPEKALPMLEQSQRDFPQDYNPPARLAVIYRALKDYDKALAASDRALALVYGPRKLAVLSVRADIYADKGDAKAARETIVQAVEYAKALPDGQRSERRIAAFEKRLAAMQ